MADMETPHVSELIRRLENLLRPGTIGQVDVQRARVRVLAGGLLTNWVPWLSLRAGAVRHWSPPSMGEQCILLAPGGDPANAMALMGLFSDGIPADDHRDHTHATRQPDGTLAEYDHQVHRDLLQCVGDILRQAEGSITHQAEGDIAHLAQGAITHRADGSILIESGVSITLRVGGASIVLTASGATVDPDIVGGGRVSLVNHIHKGVTPGLAKSGPPA